MPTIQDVRFTSACPPVDEYHFHAFSGGGMQVIALSLLDGRIEVDKDLAQIVAACTTCGLYDVACKFLMAAERQDVIMALKEHLVESGWYLPGHRRRSANLERFGYSAGEPVLAPGKWAQGLGIKILPGSGANTLLFAGAGACHDRRQATSARKLALLFQKIGKNILSTAIFAASEAEFDWKMKALRQILKETGGVIIPMNIPMRPTLLRIAGKLTRPVQDPLAPLRRFPFLQEGIQKLPIGQKIKREKQSTLFWLLFRNANNTQAAFRPFQGMATMLGAFDTWDLGHTQAEYVAQVKQKYIQEGVILNDGGDLGTGGTFESGHLGYPEGIILYNPRNPQSTLAARDLVQTGVRDAIEFSLILPIAGFGSEANEIFGPVCSDNHLWLKKIKGALDPQMASDPFFYVSGDRPGQIPSPSTDESSNNFKRPNLK